MPMPMNEMRRIEEWRVVWPACVDHLKQRLKVTVQIKGWRGNASKYQLLITVIPPPMYAAFGKTSGATSLNYKIFAVNRSGQGAGNYLCVLVLTKVNMEWRTLLISRQAPSYLQLFNAAAVPGTPHREPLSRMSKLDRQDLILRLFHLNLQAAAKTARNLHDQVQRAREPTG
jgi:hypothetical protein